MKYVSYPFRATIVCSCGAVALSALLAVGRGAGAPRPLPATAEPSVALPLPEDRGFAALEQTLKRLGTTASVMMIVAHPDDEDGALLTYLSRGMGVRATLFTLTRGEGGQNAMSADTYDALGLIRTNELLEGRRVLRRKAALGHRGRLRLFKNPGRDLRALGTRPRPLRRGARGAAASGRRSSSPPLSAASPTATASTRSRARSRRRSSRLPAIQRFFPSSLKDGLEPWQPLAVYCMVPFAPVTDKGMFDYATGKWAPAGSTTT